MTICIAGIAETFAGPDRIIVGAADHMLTAGDVEYEAPQSKIFRLGRIGSAIVSLIAGDASTQSLINTAILERTFAPGLTVEDVVNIYVAGFAELRRSLAEITHLKPLGLSRDSFLKGQHELDPQLVEELAHRLRHESLEVETIIAGVDHKGAHIYTISDPGIPRCHDSVGFVAIGSGQRHAESLFMVNRYGWNWNVGKALYLAYAAKKRSEVAPGVGKETDLFIIGLPHGFGFIPLPLVQRLDAIYETNMQKARADEEASFAEVEQMFRDVAATAAVTAVQPAPPSQAPDGKTPENGDEQK